MHAQLPVAVMSARLPLAVSCSTIPVVRVNESLHQSSFFAVRNCKGERHPSGVGFDVSGRLCIRD